MDLLTALGASFLLIVGVGVGVGVGSFNVDKGLGFVTP